MGVLWSSGKEKAKSCTLKEYPQAPPIQAVDWLEGKELGREEPGFFSEQEIMSQVSQLASSVKSWQKQPVLLRALPVGQGTWSCTSAQHWWGRLRSTAICSTSQCKRDLSTVGQDQWRAVKMIDWSIYQPVEEKAQRGSNQYLSNSSKEDRARLFSVVLADRTEGNDHELKYMRVHLNTHTKKLLWGWMLKQVV